MSRVIVLFMLLTLSLFAVDGKVKVFIKPYDSLYTSQKIILNVELMSDAFSITDVKIALDSNREFIVQAPKSAEYTGNVEVDNESWTMVHYEFTLYPLHSGKRIIKPFNVSFSTSMGYGQPKKHFQLKSQALELKVERFKGVKGNQFVLATPSYQVSSTHKEKHLKIIAGEALELSVTQKAQGVPDILLPPVRYASNSNIRVYDKEPVLESKGEFVSRKDAFTLVTTKEGNITIPSRELLWWNTKTKTLMHEKIPGMELEIIPDPQIAIDAQKKQQKERLLMILSVLVLLLLIYLALRPFIERYQKQKAEAYAQSEAAKFDKLLMSAESGKREEIYSDFYTWLESVDKALARGGFRAIAKEYPEYSENLERFQKALVLTDSSYNRNTTLSILRSLRGKVFEKNSAPRWSLGRELNP